MVGSTLSTIVLRQTAAKQNQRLVKKYGIRRNQNQAASLTTSAHCPQPTIPVLRTAIACFPAETARTRSRTSYTTFNIYRTGSCRGFSTTRTPENSVYSGATSGATSTPPTPTSFTHHIPYQEKIQELLKFQAWSHQQCEFCANTIYLLCKPEQERLRTRVVNMADRLLDRLIAEHAELSSSSSSSNNEASSGAGSTGEGPGTASTTSEQESTTASTTNTTTVPIQAWSAILRGYANVESSNTGNDQQAVQLSSHPIEKCVARLRQMKDFNLTPTTYQISTVIYACANHSDCGDFAIETAKQVIASAYGTNDLNSDGKKNIPIEVTNNLILLHAKQAANVYGAAAAAEDVLLDAAKHGKPNTKSFNLVLNAWKDSSEQQSGARAEKILRLMLELSPDTPSIAPDCYSFSTVVTAYGIRQDAASAQRILELAVQYAEQQEEQQSPHEGDNNEKTQTETSQIDLTQCWTATCYAWAQSNSPDAKERIQLLLQQANQLRNANSPIVTVKPTASMHGSYLQACGSDVESADTHLTKVVEQFKVNRKHNPAPGVTEISSVLHSWYRSGLPQAASRCTFWLQTALELSEKYRQPLVVDSGMYNLCIAAWSSRTQNGYEATQSSSNGTNGSQVNASGAARCCVDILDLAIVRRSVSLEAFASTINAWCSARQPGQAASVLERLEQYIDANAHDSIILSSWTPGYAVGLYTAVITALAKEANITSLTRALRILDDMKGVPHDSPRKVEPTVRTYTAIVAGLAKIPGKKSAKLGYELYREIEKLDSDPKSKVKLDRVLMERTLWCLCEGKTVESAEHSVLVMRYCVDQFQNKSRPDLQPTTSAMNALIQALVECHDKNAAVECVQFLKLVYFDHPTVYKHRPSVAALYRAMRACRDFEMVIEKDAINRLVSDYERQQSGSG